MWVVDAHKSKPATWDIMVGSNRNRKTVAAGCLCIGPIKKILLVKPILRRNYLWISGTVGIQPFDCVNVQQAVSEGMGAI